MALHSATFKLMHTAKQFKGCVDVSSGQQSFNYARKEQAFWSCCLSPSSMHLSLHGCVGAAAGGQSTAQLQQCILQLQFLLTQGF